MQKLISGIFDALAIGFNKIPLLNKLDGYRAVIGYLGLAVTALMLAKGFIATDTAASLALGFTAFKDLSLNAKGRP